MNIKWTINKIKEKTKEIFGDEYDIISESYNPNEKIIIRHNKCGYDFEKEVRHFIHRKQGCPICRQRRMTTEKFKTILKKDGYKLINGEANRVRDRVTIRHNECGHEYEVEVRKFVEGNRCPKCAQKRLGRINSKRKLKTNDKFIQDVKNLVGDEYIFLEDYIKNSNKMKCKHNACGHIWEIRPYDFLSNGIRCPKCSFADGRSRSEKEFTDFIKSLFNESTKIVESSREVLDGGKELDLFIPSKNIAFEFNGLYWHSERCGKERNYHLNKTLECQEKGIRLIHIFEDEWEYKREIIQSKIRHILGVNNLPKIYARKCVIKEVPSKEKKIFLEKNHIQGNDKSILNLGLYFENELVSIMTFSNLRRSLGQKSKEGIYELSRFASSIDYIVIGSFSKLFKYFINNYEFEMIITYADRRWSIGNLYDKNGFKLSHSSKPNYWYTDGNKRYHRYNFRKGKLKELFPDFYNESLTEFEIMDKTNYHRIWDCGNLVYVYKNPNRS